MSPRSLSLLLSALLPAAAFAEVYSWKDASGKAHYGDRPPVGKQAETRKLAPPPPVADDAKAAQRAVAEKRLAERERQVKEKANPTAEDPAQAMLREENCRNAKANLAGIESGQIRYRLTATGEREALDGAVREAELASARKHVAKWCSSPARSGPSAAGK